MKNIILKFINGKEINLNVKIFDKDKCILSCVTKEGKIKAKLGIKHKYLLVVNSCFYNFSIYFYVDSKNTTYIFPLSYSRIITFYLRDSNYLNLPIWKGEIIFE